MANRFRRGHLLDSADQFSGRMAHEEPNSLSLRQRGTPLTNATGVTYRSLPVTVFSLLQRKPFPAYRLTHLPEAVAAGSAS